MPNTDDAAAPAAVDLSRAPLPSHVFLLADWGSHHAGKVLAADADLMAALDLESVSHRPATEFERRIAGFVD